MESNQSKRSGRTSFLLALSALALTSACLPVPPELARGQIRGDLQRIDHALTEYAARNGVQAESIEVLAQPDRRGRVYLDRSALKDPYGHPYVYVPRTGTQPHNVICYGEDGSPGGQTDIDLAKVRRGKI